MYINYGLFQMPIKEGPPDYTYTPKVKGPLSALETKDGLSILKYPSGLGEKTPNNKNQKTHWVTFTVKEISQISSFIGGKDALQLPKSGEALQSLGASLKESTIAGTFTNILTGGLSGSISNLAGDVANTVGGFLTTGISIAPQYDETVCYISLYMPDTLNVTYNAQYEEMSLTQDLGPLLTTLRSVDSVVGGVNAEEGGIIGRIKKYLGNDAGKDPALLQAISSGLDLAGLNIPGVNTQNLATLLQKAQGFALNPQLQMVYRGTGLREFQLSFTFTPKSKTEAQNVNEIINRFRFYASPALSDASENSSSNKNMFLIPPSIFKVSFYVNGKESDVLAKYGDCVLTTIDVNNTPNGFSVFEEDGSMAQIQLNLSFKELDILTRDKINKGNAR
jgi:hypothetical protein